ncbi:RES family NAD+ phosphorylase [Chamaesiphon sp. VAR_69_metabat_338]|uniref:RES family NAD+ phosphorylase n=1 Tax=Chamaesiphon sp. VAR_69_metabat_338 TaxID=2964704 RepID=UPI00286EB21B|nr:RES family NAD+ phosphorylase [Chamaesiphon sp. VAR_69_metabat_338]
MSFSLWRISKRKYADTAFSGEGARRVGGRWNSRGQGMVYTSGTLSLAALEVFVHMEVEDVATMFAYIRVDVPTEVKVDYLEVAQLPPDWRNIPAPAVLTTMGDNWFRSGSTAILAVPSVVIPLEYNYLINPSHPDFVKLTVELPQPFELDPRLWKSS